MFVAQILAVMAAALAGALAGAWFDSSMTVLLYIAIVLVVLMTIIVTSYAVSRARHEEGEDLSSKIDSLEDEVRALRKDVSALAAGLEKPQRRCWWRR